MYFQAISHENQVLGGTRWIMTNCSKGWWSGADDISISNRESGGWI